MLVRSGTASCVVLGMWCVVACGAWSCVWRAVLCCVVLCLAWRGCGVVGLMGRCGSVREGEGEGWCCVGFGMGGRVVPTSLPHSLSLLPPPSPPSFEWWCLPTSLFRVVVRSSTPLLPLWCGCVCPSLLVTGATSKREGGEGGGSSTIQRREGWRRSSEERHPTCNKPTRD